MQEARHKLRGALTRARNNNFRPPFVRGDAVRITYKKSEYLGQTGLILRMSRAAISGGQASVVMDKDNKVITIPVQTGTTKIGIKKFGFVKIPGLKIRVRVRVLLECCLDLLQRMTHACCVRMTFTFPSQPVPTTLTANSKKRMHEVKTRRL